jgi:two-component system chemotaxis response regulator CheY
VKALIVEDDLTSRTLLLIVLSRYGECHVGVNGEEAVEAFRMALADAAPYDLICMDIRMPGMDGIEAVRRIRAMETENGILLGNGTKIIMQTTVDDPKEISQSFHASCDSYLHKPISATSLISELRKMALVA